MALGTLEEACSHGIFFSLKSVTVPTSFCSSLYSVARFKVFVALVGFMGFSAYLLCCYMGPGIILHEPLGLTFNSIRNRSRRQHLPSLSLDRMHHTDAKRADPAMRWGMGLGAMTAKTNNQDEN